MAVPIGLTAHDAGRVQVLIDNLLGDHAGMLGGVAVDALQQMDQLMGNDVGIEVVHLHGRIGLRLARPSRRGEVLQDQHVLVRRDCGIGGSE